MLKIQKMFDTVLPIKIEIPKSGKVTISLSFTSFTFKNINTLMGKIKFLIEHKSFIKKMKIRAKINSFPDVDTVIYFNLIVAYIFVEFRDLYPSLRRQDIIIPHSQSFINDIIDKTPIAQYISNKITRDQFINLCFNGENPSNIKDQFFWKVINYNNSDYNNQTCLSITSIQNFLETFSQDTTFNCQITTIIDELINNALEHSKESVLIYLTISTVYNSVTHDPHILYSICILCLSDIPIFHDISKKLECNKLASNRILNAFQNQKPLFSEKYNIRHFSIIAAMQNYVTGRDDQTNGGTGLYAFLDSIKGKLDWYKSYLISNDICMYFDKQYISQNKESSLYCFNEANDLNKLPSPDIFDNPCYSVNGVLYNLMLIKSGGMI